MNIGNIQALTFDVFGTVTDWRTTIIREAQQLGDAKGLDVDWVAFADDWRSGYMPAMQRVRSGELPWLNIDALHRIILDELLDKFQIDSLSEKEKGDLNRVWHRLDPWPDAREGLERLRQKFVVAPLSNGNISLLTNMAKHADLRWDCILSAELTKHYKPDLEVYRGAAKLLGLEPDEVMMVAAHNGDLKAAAKVGNATAFVARPTEYGAKQTWDQTADEGVDFAATDFHDLADELCG